jgi:hypothetical protein
MGRAKGYVVSEESKAKAKATRAKNKALKEQAKKDSSKTEETT